ncbi:MAG: hypothetical protein KBA31_08980 [Alphaproteobacteria bacterium]|nr:hypothetical protein [Alphaproteobacteria bacterium]
MDFVTVFDIAEADQSNWWFAVGLLAFVSLAFVVGVSTSSISRPRRRLFLGSLIVIDLLIGLSLWAGYQEDLRLRQARSSGDFSTVEGKVENFDERFDDDTEMESFSVEGVQFSYDGRRLTAAFHHVARNGGPIRSGANVRVSYVGDRIIRIDINRADIPNDNARKAYIESPPMHALTPDELRRAELPLLVAMVLISLRITLKSDLLIRAWYVFARFATGQTFRRTRGWDLAVNLFLWLNLGGAVASFTWSLLNGMEGPTWDQLPPLIFFFVAYFLMVEGLARLALRLGRSYDPGPAVPTITKLAA